jgi:hypothetical protein
MKKKRNIFFAFTGKELLQKQKIYKIEENYECWNLKKIPFDDFVNKIKRKIPPEDPIFNSNYKITGKKRRPLGITNKEYEKCSWGVLVPDDFFDGYPKDTEILFLLNLYSPNFLYPIFYVNDVGISPYRQEKKGIMTYFNSQDGSFFNKKGFADFYKKLIKQSKYGIWQLDRIQSWNKEDWRLFVASLLYSGLKDYDNSKNTFGWQRESAEMATILESLFTAEDSQNEEVGYRLRKRLAVLLSWKFSSIEKDVKDLYKERSAFVHGSFFQQIAKESPRAQNNLPTPNFQRLYEYKEYVRFALVAYLNLAQAIRSKRLEFDGFVMEALEQAIIDTNLRKKIIIETKSIFDSMPVFSDGLN